jgi:hypothetical protein
VKEQKAKGGAPPAASELQHRDVPFELPNARMGRRPMRLQILTGLIGPSSKTVPDGAASLAHDDEDERHDAQRADD